MEKISRASANQRAGRCGRVMSGICIRLYTEEDYLARPEFTDPEILRSSLAAVILRMKSLKIGEVENFPFLDPPLPRMIADGYQLLAELGAVDDSNSLTGIGWRLAKFPIDPRIARMILAAKEENCLSEVLIIASGLSVQDPRDRPFERREAADRAHQRFQDERSDFLGYLKLWDFFDELLKHKKSNRKLMAHCQENFLSHRRMREWREIHGQLHTLVMELGLRPNEIPAELRRNSSRASGGVAGQYRVQGRRGWRVSGCARNQVFHFSRFGAEKGQTQMGRGCRTDRNHEALCDAAWQESIRSGWKKLRAGCAKNTISIPIGRRQPAQVSAFERVTLYGLTIMPKRRIYYGTINPKEAREIFIRSALVAGEYADPGAVFRA